MIAIAGGKGGCGKTTTTLGLGAAVARIEGDVIAVDADVDMPDLHTVAGTSRRPGASAVADGTPIDGSLQRSLAYPGVDVLTAPEDGREFEPVFERLAARSEPVLLDTPAGASRDVTTPLRAAERTVLVTTPTRESTLDAAKTAALARELGAPPVGTIVTRSDGSIDPSELLGCPTLGHVPAVSDPSRDERVREIFAACSPAVSKRNV